MARKTLPYGIPSKKAVLKYGLRPQIEDEVIRMAKTINQRFYRLEKENLNTASYGYQVAQAELGRDKPRYVVNKDKVVTMPMDDLYRQYIQLYTKINSPSTLIHGVKQITAKRITNSLKTVNMILERVSNKTNTAHREVSRDEWTDFLNNGGGELLNNKNLDSEQIIDDWLEATRSGNISTKEFTREFKRYRTREINYGRVRANLKRLQDRKERRKKR